MVRVLPSVFVEAGQDGEFVFMLNQSQHSKTLFVFNDNEEQFDAFVRGESSGFSTGGGNAVVRPFRELQPPRSAGIPTGSLVGGGYRS